jgi:hypothetical protein
LIPSRIKGNIVIVMRATTPAWQRQGCPRSNDSNNAIIMRATFAIATMAKTPVHQRQQRHRNKGNNAIAMTARMPAH